MTSSAPRGIARAIVVTGPPGIGDLRNACIQHGYVGYGFLEVGELLEAERALRATFHEAERLGLSHAATTATIFSSVLRASVGETKATTSSLR